MLPVPAVQRRRNVHRPIYEGGVQSNRERKILKRNVAQSKGEGEGIERARGQSRQNQRYENKAVIVIEGKKIQITVNNGAATNKIRFGGIRPPRYTVNGPMNIRTMSKAVPIQALSS